MQIYKQRFEYDCLLACLATAVQIPYEQLWADEIKQIAQDKQGIHGHMVDAAFEQAGLRKETDYWCVTIYPQAPMQMVRALLNGRRAILQVRSLNTPGAGHFIYWAGEQLYDVSNLQQYRWIDQCFPEYVWIFNEIKP
ncbi:MAG TPA: hypothetical protein VLB68_29100 [Pyrinomonadaceae bacterium]|nr:hypothetical protein [Pyrinomonadaceae bacterium]